MSAVKASARSEVAVVTSTGQAVRLQVLDLPTLPATAAAPSLAGGAPLSEFVDLDRGESALGLASLDPGSSGLALGTASGVVKRVGIDPPANKDRWDLIALKDGDQVVGFRVLTADDEELVFITSDGQLLHFPATSVRPQGRAAGGMAGVRLSGGSSAVFFGAVDVGTECSVVTVAGSSAALPGTDAGYLKVSPFGEYPAKGRGTGGVRCHRFLKGVDTLILAWAGNSPSIAAAATGVAIDLPEAASKRDGSGSPPTQPIAAVSTRVWS